MDARISNLGSSLDLPCVKELVKDPLRTVPPRYVRFNQGSAVTQNFFSTDEIPVISLQNLLSEDLHNSELRKLHFACKEWGFFQLIDHGISSTLMEKVKGEIKDLFELPMEEKKKLWQEPGDMQGFGQHFVVSNEQKLDWGDMFSMKTLPIHIRKQELLSKLCMSFRETIEAYSLEMNKIFMILLHQMVKALDITQLVEITDLFEEAGQGMRLNCYPPCPQPDLVMGLTPHSDASSITIVLQLNEVEGLQVRKDGIWVPIKPHRNTFVVNIGDILEIITNGIYRSAEHRAIVNKENERLSIATFHGPKSNVQLCPAPSLVTRENPAQFRKISVQDFYEGTFSRELDGKSYLEIMRIKTKEREKN